ncbi:MAG: lytic transglycosylase domain-containing protein [Rhodospirillales bacterium]|nr:MAG: lytic transglycosylase domain-containing protein [Rhodospirillales bacterium]
MHGPHRVATVRQGAERPRGGVAGRQAFVRCVGRELGGVQGEAALQRFGGAGRAPAGRDRHAFRAGLEPGRDAGRRQLGCGHGRAARGGTPRERQGAGEGGKRGNGQRCRPDPDIARAHHAVPPLSPERDHRTKREPRKTEKRRAAVPAAEAAASGGAIPNLARRLLLTGRGNHLGRSHRERRMRTPEFRKAARPLRAAAVAAAFAASFAIAGAFALVTAAPARAAGQTELLCAAAIAAEEVRSGIPRHLLAAIALAESGRWDAARKASVAWPWTVMAEGRGQFFPTRDAAIAHVKRVRARGVRNIDVGCMQINLMYHPDAFTGLEQAFDPARNVAYAARYLSDLRAETGSWEAAAGRYHSATPAHNARYRRTLARLWRDQQAAGDSALIALAPDGTAAATPARTHARIVPVDPARTARLAAAFQARTGADRGPAAAAPAGNTALRAGPVTRTAAAEAAFAERRREHLAAWRQSRTGRR